MPDLLADIPNTFIRFSSAGGCSLAIGHRLMGTPEGNQRNHFSIPMRKGRWLEPMVVEWLADNGFAVWFANDQQLEVQAQDPFRQGHPDGLISILPSTELTWWANRNVPKMALDLMLTGELFLLEIKTMNPESFALFKREGLSEKDTLFRKYRFQIQGYLNTIADVSNDEIWDSEDFRALLKEYSYERPRYCLVVAFCPATNDYSFSITEIDPVPFELNAKRLHEEVIYPMRVEGRLPDPSYDGSAAECFFCAFADICPAVIARRSSSSDEMLESMPLSIGLSFEEVDSMASQYKQLKTEIKGLEQRAADLKDALQMAIVPGQPLVTTRYRIKYTPIAGRRTIDMETLKAMAAAGGWDIPYKDGQPYLRPYITPLFGDDYERGAD